LATLFSDNFNRANSATVDATNWTENESGSNLWSISSNELVRVDSGPSVTVITTTSAHAAVADCKASHKRTNGSGFDGGPCVRATSNGQNFYYLDFYLTDTIEIYRRVSNSDTLLATRTQTHGVNDIYKLEVSGTGATVTLKAYRNGVQLGADISDSDASRITSAGQTGLISWTPSNFDDFLAEDLAGGGATINADARIAAGSRALGLSAVSKTTNARIAAGSRQSGQTAVARVASSRIAAGSGARGSSAVSKVAQAVIAARSGLRGLSSIAGLVFSEARLAFRSAFRGLGAAARVTASRIAARSGLTGQFFQDTTPIAAKVLVSSVTRATIVNAHATRATIASAPVTRATIRDALATRAKVGAESATRAKITVQKGG
jgi:hypothetical protein